MKSDFLKFPDNFYWGASSSAHQVEGHNTNDWSQWELDNCKKLAAEAKSGYFSNNKYASPAPLWNKIGTSAENPENYISGHACDHYNRFSDDFNIAKKLKHSAHRFSIEWSRIEPVEGEYNQEEIEHYRRVIHSLKERDIEPFITLWHFSNPVWFRDKGGWEAKDAAGYFSRYVNKIMENFKDEVNFWITINEPMVYATSSYLWGAFPAQKKNIVSYLLAINNLIKAHKSAYAVIKGHNPEARVGIAKSIIFFHAYKNRIFNVLLKKALDWPWNNYFLNRIDSHQDFIGVNHYFHNSINYGLNKNKNKVLSDMGWELYPEAIYHSLKELRKYRKPLYVTENGLADADDSRRAWYIKEVLKNVHRAIQENVDVRGYLHWSFMDNFEWHKGFWPRFGLIEIDHHNFKRKVRKSAIEYARIIEYNGVTVDRQ